VAREKSDASGTSTATTRPKRTSPCYPLATKATRHIGTDSAAGFENFFAELGALAETGPPEEFREKRAELAREYGHHFVHPEWMPDLKEKWAEDAGRGVEAGPSWTGPPEALSGGSGAGLTLARGSSGDRAGYRQARLPEHKRSWFEDDGAAAPFDCLRERFGGSCERIGGSGVDVELALRERRGEQA
jgi:hypothetical protein